MTEVSETTVTANKASSEERWKPSVGRRPAWMMTRIHGTVFGLEKLTQTPRQKRRPGEPSRLEPSGSASRGRSNNRPPR